MRTSPPSPVRSRSRKALALAGAGALVMLAASPGVAAEPVAEGSATGLVITLLNTPTDSGSFTASNDGTRTTESGAQDPLIEALGNQSFIDVGTLAQSAVATSSRTAGSSAACSGLAGDGATLVAVEDGFCLEPGDNATINAGTFALQDVTLVQADLLAGLDTTLQAALQPVLTPVLGAADTVVQTVLTSIGDPTIGLDLGVIQSQCAATPAAALGDSQLTDASLFLEAPGIGRVDLIEFPTVVPPNTKLLTNLDVVVDAVSLALQTQLNTALDGALGPVAGGVAGLTDALNDNIVSAVAEQLAPLEENVLDVTLNKQVNDTAPEFVEVTALDLRLLPAAADFVDVANVEIGRSSCSAAPLRAVPPPTDDPTDDPSDPTSSPADPSDPTPAIPTSVPAGEAGASFTSNDGALNGRIATGAIVVLTMLTAAGATFGFRKVLRG